MFKKVLILSSFVALTLSAMAQDRLNGSFDYALFKLEDGTPYIETYLKVFAGTFHYKPNANGTYSANLEILLMASSTPDKVDWFDKYKINTGELAAKDTGLVSVLDGKRFVVKEGKFRLDLRIVDLNSPGSNVVEYADSIVVNTGNGGNKPVISTPVLLDRYSTTVTENAFSKSGYDIIPNTTGFYDGETNEMSFYAEVYGTPAAFGEGERFVVRYHLKNFETGFVVPGTEGMSVSPVKPVYAALFPISLKNVGPGNYSVVLEVRNKNNEIVTSTERVFQRGGRVNFAVIEDLSAVGTDFMALVENVDTLREYIRCLNPISPRQEQDFARNVLKGGDKEMMKRYIVSFWTRRDPANPYKAWAQYKAQVQLAQQLYGTQYLRAYQTDRGRVFLQYGPPNVRTERPNEPMAYPYEIWQYYEMYNPITQMKQTNRRFVFWNPDGASNVYELLHSDALSETRNDRWEMVLYNRGGSSSDIDQTSPGYQNGGMSRDLFNNPR